jgi:hypothetical protein
VPRHTRGCPSRHGSRCPPGAGQRIGEPLAGAQAPERHPELDQLAAEAVDHLERRQREPRLRDQPATELSDAVVVRMVVHAVPSLPMPAPGSPPACQNGAGVCRERGGRGRHRSRPLPGVFVEPRSAIEVVPGGHGKPSSPAGRTKLPHEGFRFLFRGSESLAKQLF